jgi:hypothetical protein
MKTEVLHLEFEHDEPHVRFLQDATAEFLRNARSLGFTLKRLSNIPQPTTETRADVGVAEVTVVLRETPQEKPGALTMAETAAMLLPDTTPAVPDVEIAVSPEPLTLKQIKARIREEKKATGGNKVLSQAELAERIGVSVHYIRKALK